eukprot:2061892-Amphidinium_carterae.1
MACAVSGLKYPCMRPAGPIGVGNIRLNGSGSVKSLPLSGALICHVATQHTSKLPPDKVSSVQNREWQPCTSQKCFAALTSSRRLPVQFHILAALLAATVGKTCCGYSISP